MSNIKDQPITKVPIHDLREYLKNIVKSCVYDKTDFKEILEVSQQFKYTIYGEDGNRILMTYIKDENIIHITVIGIYNLDELNITIKMDYNEFLNFMYEE